MVRRGRTAPLCEQGTQLTHGKTHLAVDHLVLSLLNTSRETTDPLESSIGCAMWWASVQPALASLPLRVSRKPRFDARLASELRRFREALASAIDAAAPLCPALTGQAELDGVLLPLVYASLALLSSARLRRLRACYRRDCGRRFLDQTKNGSRRWCSLRCMERSRVPRRRRIAA